MVFKPFVRPRMVPSEIAKPSSTVSWLNKLSAVIVGDLPLPPPPIRIHSQFGMFRFLFDLDKPYHQLLNNHKIYLSSRLVRIHRPYL